MPLAEITTALRWFAVSAFDCCGDTMVWKRAVANAETCFVVGRMSGSSSAARDA